MCFYVYSNWVLESHIEILRRVLLCVSPQIHTRTRTKSRVMGFADTLEGDKDIFDSILKPLIVQSSLPIGKDINVEDSDDSPIVNRKAVNLFCE